MINRRRLVLSSLVAGAVPLTLTAYARAADTLVPGREKESEGRLGSISVNETVARYMSAWNERDPKRRRALVAATWTEDGSYIDAHRHGTGFDAIDAMLAAAQAHFPGYRLRLIRGIEAHNNVVRFSWAAGGTEEAPLYLGGTDFATLASDGRFRTVAGFTDAAPAPIR
jgi:SnoaL-like domain